MRAAGGVPAALALQLERQCIGLAAFDPDDPERKAEVASEAGKEVAHSCAIVFAVLTFGGTLPVERLVGALTSRSLLDHDRDITLARHVESREELRSQTVQVAHRLDQIGGQGRVALAQLCEERHDNGRVEADGRLHTSPVDDTTHAIAWEVSLEVEDEEPKGVLGGLAVLPQGRVVLQESLVALPVSLDNERDGACGFLGHRDLL